MTLTLYASTPGAFSDLAADLAWLTGQDLGEFVVDQDLPPSLSDPQRIAAQSDIDQAIGVLIGRGNTPDQATAILHHDSHTTRTSLHAAASTILQALREEVPDPPPGGEY